MTKMKAVGYYKGLPITDSASFQDVLVEKPQPQANDLLVKVLAVSVNPVDTKIRQSTPEQTQVKIIGYDAVAEVVALGTAVKDYQVGQRVYYAGTTQRPGSDAEFQLIDARLVALAPEKLTVNQAAALPLTALTAYELLFEKMGLIPVKNANNGKSLLVINGAGGVGSLAIQLAKWAGLTVIATASPKNHAWLKELGADYAVDYHQDLRQQITTLGFDLLDNIVILHSTARYFDLAADLIGPFGHVGSIVGSTERLALAKLKNKSASFDWEYMFAKTDYDYQVASQGAILKQIAKLLDQGVLRTTLTQTITAGINATTMKKAHAIVEANAMVGKLVVTGPFNG